MLQSAEDPTERTFEVKHCIDSNQILLGDTSQSSTY
jgi:hypothetical protein